jgi:hypothetical protein
VSVCRSRCVLQVVKTCFARVCDGRAFC